MGAWGTGLYSSDLALDIKDDYIDRLKRGESNEEITQSLINEYQEIINDPEDALEFWFALADIQWKYGRLVSSVINHPFIKT